MKRFPALLLLSLAVAPPVAAQLTMTGKLIRADTVRYLDSTMVGDTVTFKKGFRLTVTTLTEVVESTWTRRPVTALGLPFGLMHLPPDSLGAYTLTHLSAGTGLLNQLAKVRAKGGKAVVGLPLGKTRAPEGSDDAVVQTHLGRAELLKLPKDLKRYIDDGTVLGLYIGDDIVKPGAGPLTLTLPRYDSIACLARDSFPTAAIILRARATQLMGRTWRCLTTVQAQYGHGGPRRFGQIQPFIVSEVKAAKALKLGLILDVNQLNSGCGPPNKQPSDPAKRCPPNITGSAILGTPDDAGARDYYQPSAAEHLYLTSAALAEPYVCAVTGWQASYFYPYQVPQLAQIRAFHARADIRANVAALSLLARKRPAASCIHPDRRR